MEIAAESRAFLIQLLTSLRKDLGEGAGAKGGAEAARQLSIIDRLLPGLEQSAPLPIDEETREFVVGLGNATDVENQYDRVALEHRALEELSDALAGRK
jgi:hypothetical protein